MEAPAVGAAALTPSPSNFQAIMEQRNNAANDNQPALQQPDVGRNSGYKQPAREEDPTRIEKQLDGSQAGEQDEFEGDPEQQLEPEAPEGEPADPIEAAKTEFLGKLAEQLEQGKLPVDQLGEMLVTVPLPGGREVEVPLKELQRGFLRQNDYTRKLQEATQLRDQGQRVLQLERQRRVEWQNEEILIRDLNSMGLSDAFERAVMRHAEQTVRFRQLPPIEQQRIMHARQLEQMKAAAEAERQQLLQHLQQQQPANQQAEVTRHFQAQLSQLLPSAFKQHGIPTYPKAREVFMENLERLYEGGPCTRELVDDACQATKYELEDMAQRLPPAQRPRQPGQPLPPRRVSGAAGAGVQSFTGNGKRSRPSDFGRRFAGSGT